MNSKRLHCSTTELDIRILSIRVIQYRVSPLYNISGCLLKAAVLYPITVAKVEQDVPHFSRTADSSKTGKSPPIHPSVSLYVLIFPPTASLFTYRATNSWFQTPLLYRIYPTWSNNYSPTVCSGPHISPRCSFPTLLNPPAGENSGD